MISIDEYILPCAVAGSIITALYIIFSITIENLLFSYVKSEFRHKLYNIVFTVIFIWTCTSIAAELIKYVI